jgi:hypothetical protein
MDLRKLLRLSGCPAYLGPVLVAAVIVAPCIGITYLWDDYDFLNNALGFHATDLLPTASRAAEPFYRPVSRGLYFTLLNTLGPAGELVGHLLNASIFLLIVALLVRLVERLRGRRSAVVAGIAFAGLGVAPLLVCWASGSQDLLAIACVLAAIHLHLSGRPVAGVLLTSLGILSKETVVVVVPAIALSRLLLFRDRSGLGRTIVLYSSLLAAWLLIHPGVHRLIHNGLRTGETGYVGIEQPERWPTFFMKYALLFFNCAPGPPSLPLALFLLPNLLLAAASVYAIIRWGACENSAAPSSELVAPVRVGGWALLLLVPPLLLTSTFLRGWAPYYATFVGVGWAVLLCLLVDRIRPALLAPALAGFVLLGAWPRTAPLKPGTVTEHNLRSTSMAIDQVRRNLRRLCPSMPRGAQVLASVQVGGLTGLYTHFYYFQALRVWYRDSSLTTTRPDWRVALRSPDVLLWANQNLDVFEIDLNTLTPRGTGIPSPREEYLRTLRYYARGLAAGGETNRALNVLLSVDEPNQSSWALDRRLAAMFLFYAGRDAEATQLLLHVPRVHRDNALEIVTRLVTDPPPGPSWDGPALRAFDIDPSDPESCRYLMRHFAELDRRADATRFAVLLLAVIPTDSEAKRTLERLRVAPAPQPFTLPTDPGIW